MSLRNHELTNHSNIYKSVYWGNFQYDQSIANIIHNRNRFINDFNIKSVKSVNIISDYCYHHANGYYHRLFDHIETYKTNDNKFIIVISPYGNENDFNRDIDVNEFKIKLGFEQIYPLYDDATTFVKVIDDIKQFKKLSKIL